MVMNIVKRIHRNSRGSAILEYAIAVALIAAICIFSLRSAGEGLSYRIWSLAAETASLDGGTVGSLETGSW